MDKEELISLAEKIKQALNAISVSGYSNLRTLANCMDALTELEKKIDTYEKDIHSAIEQQIKEFTNSAIAEAQNNQRIIPVDIQKPKPKRIKKEVTDDGED